MNFNFSDLPPVDPQTGLANVIIDTPKGSRNKFKFDEKAGLFKLKHVLPEGTVFPFDFGFIPNTITEDGDPLDVLVLLEAPAFAGCLVQARMIGVLEAEQTGPDGKTQRNDRLIGIFPDSPHYKHVQELRDLPKALLDEVEHFFRSYNQMREIDFKITHRSGKNKALTVIQKGIKYYKNRS